MNNFLTLNEFLSIYFGVMAIGFIGVVLNSIFQSLQARKRASFGLSLIRLIDDAKCGVKQAWGNQGESRLLVQGINDLLDRIKKTGKENDYLSYLILSHFPNNEYKKFEAYHLKGKKLDLKGDLSVQDFLQRVIKRADVFLDRKKTAQKSFEKVDDFSGPHKVYLKIEDGYIHFLLFDELIYCNSFQIIYPLHDFLEKKENKEKISKKPITNMGYTSLGYTFEFEPEKFRVRVKMGLIDYSFSCENNSFNKALNKQLTSYFGKIQYHQ